MSTAGSPRLPVTTGSVTLVSDAASVSTTLLLSGTVISFCFSVRRRAVSTQTDILEKPLEREREIIAQAFQGEISRRRIPLRRCRAGDLACTPAAQAVRF